MTDELILCPFCGGGGAGYMDDVQYPDTPNERVWYAVTCGKCDANGAWDLGKSGAAEKWNTRAVEDALRARIAELEERLTPVKFSERKPEAGQVVLLWNSFYKNWIIGKPWIPDPLESDDDYLRLHYPCWLPLPPAPEESA